MPALKNITKEMFAREIIKQNGHISNAYKKIYKPNYTNPQEIGANACHALNLDVRKRVSELLDKSGLSLPELNIKLQNLLNHKKPLVVDGNVEFYDDGNVQLSTATLAYKLHGVLSNSEVDNSVKITQNSLTQVNNLNQFNMSLQSISELTDKLSHKNKLSGKIVNDVIDVKVDK